MEIKRKRLFKPEVYTSSLNDIMFFLLLFFLIVSSLANPNVIKLLLPNSKSAQNINKQQITISITKDKKYFIDNKQIKFSDIEPLLKSRAGSLQEPTVILRLENSLSVQDLVDVLEIGNRLKVKMFLATNKKSGS
ncbi:MAG TPA: biopolymer transporter ExbD [Bacteroidales bacterium]|nr:biopolymer transporter ExbD [Bacteroidales bacterium]